jgi:hypothetical protein
LEKSQPFSQKLPDVNILPTFIIRAAETIFLVPKPLLGNALAGEAPASRDGRRPEAGASGADAFPSGGLGTRKNPLYVKIRIAAEFLT